MPFRICDWETESKFCRALTGDAISRAIPMAAIEAVLQAHRARATRERKLTLEAVVLLVIALHLSTQFSRGDVLEKIAHGWGLIWADPEVPLPNNSAIAYRVTKRPNRCRRAATERTRGWSNASCRSSS